MYQCGRDSHLRGRFVRYPSVNLSPTLSRNEKVEQHIRKKTHKPNALKFWVEGGVILLYGLAQFSFLFVSPVFTPSNYPTSGIRALGLGQNPSTSQPSPMPSPHRRLRCPAAPASAAQPPSAPSPLPSPYARLRSRTPPTTVIVRDATVVDFRILSFVSVFDCWFGTPYLEENVVQI